METPAPPPANFGAVNYAVLVLYLLAMVGVGWWCHKRVTSARTFFLGNERMNHVLVGLSLLGAYLSGVTMMALPRLAYGDDDLTWTVQLPFLAITAAVITGFVLPRYRAAGVISVYEYLEQRIHVSARLLASAGFVFLAAGRMGLSLYLPALAFSMVTGSPIEYSILGMGVVVVLYTAMGGIEAVIWTDAIQVVVFVAAALFSLVLIFTDASATASAAGTSFWGVAAEHGKLRVLAPGFDVTKVLSLWLVLETLVQTVRIYGTQQDMTQRYMTTASTREANKSVWISILGYIPLGYLFYFLGTALFVYYTVRPDPNIPALMKIGPDALYPRFVVDHLPLGLPGLVIAGIFAAAMSTISALMNAASTVCVRDFYQRFARREHSEAHYLKVARGLTILWGILHVAFALALIGSEKAAVTWSQIMALSTNGVLALMVLAFLPIRVKPAAAIIGFVAGYVALFYIRARTDIVFLLWPVYGNGVALLVALLANVLLGGGQRWEEREPGAGQPRA